MEETLTRSAPITIHAAATAALAAPSAAGDGGDVSSLGNPTANIGPSRGFVRIVGAGAVTIAGPVWLCRYDGAAWYKVMRLNGGDAIVVTATLHFEEPFDEVLPDTTRMALYDESGAAFGSTVTVYVGAYN